MVRVRPSAKQRSRLILANAGRCCVCKRRGVGLHLHHIDEDNANTVDSNLAVLCVEDHDHHHRPAIYTKACHIELSKDQLRKYKTSWESFVIEARKESPKVIAVINAFGELDRIHAAKIVFQWPDEKIEFERTFHLLEGDLNYWVDGMLDEVQSIGRNVKLAIVDDPLPIEYCPCCRRGLSNTIKEVLVLKATDPTWSTLSILSIYINPDNPSLAVSLGLPNKHLYSGVLHLCKGSYLHYSCDYYDERIEITRKPSVRTQVTQLVQKIVSEFEPAHVLIGTGNHDSPNLIDNFNLPKIWEDKASRKKTSNRR